MSPIRITLSSYSNIYLATFIKNVTIAIIQLHFLKIVTTKNININIVTFLRNVTIDHYTFSIFSNISNKLI